MTGTTSGVCAVVVCILLCVVVFCFFFFLFLPCDSQYSFDVTEQRNAAQCPVFGIEIGLEINGTHILEVGALRLPINWALIQLGILAGGCVNGIYIYDRHLFIQHLHFGLNQLAAASIQ